MDGGHARTGHSGYAGFCASYDHPTEGKLKAPAFPVRFSEMAERSPAVAPRLGEHTRTILERLDYDDDGIEALLAAGVVAAP